MSENLGHSNAKNQKIRVVIYFLLKKGVYHIPGATEKGGYSARTSNSQLNKKRKLNETNSNTTLSVNQIKLNLKF